MYLGIHCSVLVLMFIKSLSSFTNRTLISKNPVLLTFNFNKKKMSTLENVIDGLNNVKCRIKLAISKRDQVPIIIYNLLILIVF